jgi:hypothetical protein
LTSGNRRVTIGGPARPIFDEHDRLAVTSLVASATRPGAPAAASLRASPNQPAVASRAVVMS